MEKITASVYSKSSEIRGWEYFYYIDKPPYTIAGKYLFFSYNRDLLVDIAIAELDTGSFHHAKVNLPPPVKEYVLCLYYQDDSRKYELAKKYKNRPELKYRYWKSDEDTRLGKYAEEFLKSQDKRN